MERRVKERLIGATILVVVVVALVPEFLSGPHNAGVRPVVDTNQPGRTFLVDSTHIATAPPAPQPPSTSSSAPEAGAASAIEPAAVAPAAPAAAPPPAAAPAPAPAVKPAAPAAASAWVVQLGSFASKANAESLMHQLNAEGFSTYLAPTGSGGAKRYRVRVGPFADRSAATASIAKLQAHRHTATLIPPNG